MLELRNQRDPQKHHKVSLGRIARNVKQVVSPKFSLFLYSYNDILQMNETNCLIYSGITKQDRRQHSNISSEVWRNYALLWGDVDHQVLRSVFPIFQSETIS